MKNQMSLLIPVSWGEFVDKITILEIKADRIIDTNKLHNVHKELIALQEVGEKFGGLSARVLPLAEELRNVNAKLWDIEDAIRDCERTRDFGERFVTLARSVYRANDHRATLKRQINDAMGSELIEEKSYQDYE